MLVRLFALLFILKLRFYRNRNLIDYLREKYDGSVLRTYQSLESSIKKWKKAQLDYDFLLYCKMSALFPISSSLNCTKWL